MTTLIKMKTKTATTNASEGGTGEPLSSESFELSKLVRNTTRSLVDRIESYEDIINLEIGDTSMSRARNMERSAGFRQLYLKFEGSNPTGTHKDRIAFTQCLDAIRRGYDTVTLATCGNYGVSMSLAAQLAGLKCRIYIPKQYHTARLLQMIKLGGEVRFVDGSYEDCVAYSRKKAHENSWYDANPGGSNTALQIMAYAQISYEIYDQLRDAPKVVAVPVSNGTLLAGVYRGFVSLFKRGKVSRIPMLVAASSTGKNPIIYSFNKGLDQCTELLPGRIRETPTNEPLINWHSFDGDEALYALQQTKGKAFNISDKKMQQMSTLLKEKEGLSVLPASTVGLVALMLMNQEVPLETDRYVAIITSKK